MKQNFQKVEIFYFGTTGEIYFGIDVDTKKRGHYGFGANIDMISLSKGGVVCSLSWHAMRTNGSPNWGLARARNGQRSSLGKRNESRAVHGRWSSSIPFAIFTTRLGE